MYNFFVYSCRSVQFYPRVRQVCVSCLYAFGADTVPSLAGLARPGETRRQTFELLDEGGQPLRRTSTSSCGCLRRRSARDVSHSRRLGPCPCRGRSRCSSRVSGSASFPQIEAGREATVWRTDGEEMCRRVRRKFMGRSGLPDSASVKEVAARDEAERLRWATELGEMVSATSTVRVFVVGPRTLEEPQNSRQGGASRH